MVYIGLVIEVLDNVLVLVIGKYTYTLVTSKCTSCVGNTRSRTCVLSSYS